MRTCWDDWFDAGEDMGIHWLKVWQSADGPMANLSLGESVILPIEPQPPVGKTCEVLIKRTKAGTLIGKWTGKIQ